MRLSLLWQIPTFRVGAIATCAPFPPRAGLVACCGLFTTPTSVMFFNFLPTTLQYLLATYIFTYPTTDTITTRPLKFGLRHALGVSNSTSRLVFSDIQPTTSLTEESYAVNARMLKVSRARDQSKFFDARVRGAQRTIDWDDTDVVGPDVRDRETLLMLAKMTNNAYSEPGNKDWYDLGPDWNSVRNLIASVLAC